MYRPGQELRASDLNRLQAQAQAQSLQGATAGTYNNGQGVVNRNPKRIASKAKRPTGARAYIGEIVGGTPASGWDCYVYPHYPDLITGRFLVQVDVVMLAWGADVTGGGDNVWVVVNVMPGMTALEGN